MDMFLAFLNFGMPIVVPAPTCRDLAFWESPNFVSHRAGKKKKKSAHRKHAHLCKSDRRHCGQSQFSSRMNRKDRLAKA